MKVVTVLGKGFPQAIEEERPIYQYDERLKGLYSLKKQRYTNMLPLLLDNFGVQNVSPIFTKTAKNTNIDVLDKEFGADFTEIFNPKNYIDGEKDFYKILHIINEATGGDDEYIIDLTHGFRHIPILATISLISQSLSGTKKIKHIFFAKEIINLKKYEIIDLKEYLELANMSYMLETFNQNYTVSSMISFENEKFQELADELRLFSNHIMSNSLKALKNSFNKLLFNIENIQNYEQIETFRNSLEDIKEHIKELEAISKMSDYQSLYEMARILNAKGYLLNAITLLFEAIGYYCACGIESINPQINSYVKTFKDNSRFDAYNLVNESRILVKVGEKKTSYLFGIESAKEIFRLSRSEAQNYLKNIKDTIISNLDNIQNIKEFRDFIFKAEVFRNNLTHGNSSKEIDNSKQELYTILKEYKKFCIDGDILRVR